MANPDPVDVIHQKMNLATQSLQYLSDRSLAPNYNILKEGPQLELQRNRFVDALDDLNTQLAVVVANENAVVAPTQDQLNAVIAATSAVEKLNSNQAIATAALGTLNAALTAAQPLVKSA